MSDIEFIHLHEVQAAKLIALMNDARVRKYLPLLAGGFSPTDCRAFVEAKQQLWNEHGYGPWAFLIHGEFAGWGGLQPEQGEADIAMVLDPRYWGWGRRIFRAVVAHAFEQLDLSSITALLPPSRPNARAITRLGFIEDGELTVGGQPFVRFRLINRGPESP